MRTALLALVAGVLGLALGQDGSVAFEDVRIFDGHAVHEDVNVVVEDGVVRAVGGDATIPAGAAAGVDVRRDHGVGHVHR